MAIPNAKWLAAGKQVICKQDFIDLENAILGIGGVGDGAGATARPPLIWIDNASVRLEATPDSQITLPLAGVPNICSPGSMVAGGLSDGLARTITANAVLSLASDLWGAEKASQWYAVFATALTADTDFVLKAMPWLRVLSQASQVISLGTHLDPGNGIGYGFTTDEMVGGKVYFMTGDSKGLLREITANNNDSTSGGTVTYSGAALTLAEGDWFIILPPGLNVLWLGDLFNDASSNATALNDLIFGLNSYLFTATGKWFCPFTWYGARVNGVAGGGGGGNYNDGNGIGGKAGASAIALFKTVIPGMMYTVTIGGGGAGATNNSGAAGGNTVLDPFVGGAILTLTGGAGGGISALIPPGQASSWGPGALLEGENGGNYGGGGAGKSSPPAGNGAPGFLEIYRA